MTDEMWAICCQVPLAVYGPDQLDDRLHDIDWIGQVAVRHEAIVEQLAATGATVVPMKLFTMFSSEQRAVTELGRNRRGLAEVFARVNGCQEWGVQVFSRDHNRTSRARRKPPPTSGTAFLTAKKRLRDQAHDRAEQATEAALNALESLAACARSVARRDVPAGATRPPLVDAAFLVPSTERTRFLQVVRKSAAECRRAGASLHITGPWPPYNFVASARGERR